MKLLISGKQLLQRMEQVSASSWVKEVSSTGMKYSSCLEVPETGLVSCVGKPCPHPYGCISSRRGNRL